MSKTKPDYQDDRDLYSGLIRLHILHHAAEEPIFGSAWLKNWRVTVIESARELCIRFCTALRKKGYLPGRGGVLPRSGRNLPQTDAI